MELEKELSLKKQHLDHEGVIMPYTMEDFERDFTREHLHLLPPEERLKGLLPEERLKGLSAETIFKRFSPEERLKGLPPEVSSSTHATDFGSMMHDAALIHPTR